MKKIRWFIPGIRAGKPADYVDSSKITLAGAVFLAINRYLANFLITITGVQAYTLVVALLITL